MSKSTRSTSGHRPWGAWLVALALGVAAAGCTDAPSERYTQALAAAEQKNFDGFRAFFTRSSAELLRGFESAGKRSRLYYVKEPMTLLPKGPIENAVEVENFAVLTFTERGKKADVWMFLEDGEWKIDLTTLPGFWAYLSQP